MKKILYAISMMALLLCACSKDEPVPTPIPDKPNKEEPGDSNTEEQPYPPGTVEYFYYVEKGLKPSQKENINNISDFIENEDCYYLLGQRNNNAWISKLDKSGNEIFDYEAPKIENWSHSYFNDKSIIFSDEKYFFAKEWYANTDNASQGEFLERLCIISLSNGEETDEIHKLQGEVFKVDYNTFINKSYNRYYIKSYAWIGSDYNQFCIVGENGKYLYGRKWDYYKEGLFIGDNMIFIDDERVCNPTTKGFRLHPDYEYKIINLKEWKLLASYSINNGLIPIGDNYGKENIQYETDTAFLTNKFIKFVYNEIEIDNKKDPITGNTIEAKKQLGTYFYEINTDTYEIEFKGIY